MPPAVRFGQTVRVNEPEFSNNVRLTGEYLQLVDTKYLQSREYLRVFPAGVDITAPPTA